MEKYIVVIEKGENNYSAFSPDVWGCVATGKTVEEVTEEIKEALQFHIESMVESGEDVPQPKGLLYHINEGVFKDDEIEPKYYITEVNVPVPQHA
ncbi:MAG: type II toxin-antitoxin system HicB family antitoxin [Bacteroidota bacterium]